MKRLLNATFCIVIVFCAPISFAQLSMTSHNPYPGPCNNTSCQILMSVHPDPSGKSSCVVELNFDEIDVGKGQKPTMQFILVSTGETYEFDDPNNGEHDHHHGAEPNSNFDPSSDLQNGRYGGPKNDNRAIYLWDDRNKNSARIGVDLYVYEKGKNKRCDSHDPVVINGGE